MTVASLLAAGGFVVIGTLLLFFNAPLFAILLFLILFDCFVVLIESLTAGALLFILLLILLIVFYQKILHLHGSDVYLYAGAYFFLSGELITGRYKKQKKHEPQPLTSHIFLYSCKETEKRNEGESKEQK